MGQYGQEPTPAPTWNASVPPKNLLGIPPAGNTSVQVEGGFDRIWERT
jgi:hypothetical protein